MLVFSGEFQLNFQKMKTMKTMFIQLGFFLFTFLPSSWSLITLNQSVNHRAQMDKLVTLIVTSCYQDPYPVVVYDNDDYNLARVIQITGLVPIVLYDPMETYNWRDRQYHLANKQYSNKANFIFISCKLTELFYGILPTLQHTPWWNHMATVIIIDQSPHSCKDNRDLLRMLWKNDILKLYFLCYDNNEKIIIFTYNPYTNRAPKPWRPVDALGDRKYYPWTLYYRIYHNQGKQCHLVIGFFNSLPKYFVGPKICKNFDFDRTKHLDGYNQSKALICVSEERLSSTMENLTRINIIKQHTYVSQLIMKTLNLDFSIIFRFVNLSNISEGNDYRDKKLADFYFCPSPMWKLEKQAFHFHPIAELEFVIVSRYRGLKTPLEIMGDFYGFFIISLTIIILFITYCVIIVSQNQQNYFFAFFEILRLLRNTGIVSNISTLHLRIFFMMIFFYFLILHATFSSHLSSFLTHNQARDTPETLADLRGSFIKNVYVPYVIKINNLDLKIKKKLVTTYDINCEILFNVNNYNYACITFKQIIINYVEKKNLQISKNSIQRDQFSYFSRNTWPLNSRINEFIIRLEQSHVISYRINSYVKSVEDNMKRKIEMKLKKYRPIKLNDLLFAFYFLVTGLSIATISFFVEVMKNKMANKKKENKK